MGFTIGVFCFFSVSIFRLRIRFFLLRYPFNDFFFISYIFSQYHATFEFLFFSNGSWFLLHSRFFVIHSNLSSSSLWLARLRVNRDRLISVAVYSLISLFLYLFSTGMPAARRLRHREVFAWGVSLSSTTTTQKKIIKKKGKKIKMKRNPEIREREKN